MEKFDESFFEEEWRSDFLVESKMKRAWAAQIEILMEIDRICKKNSIQYFADSGTLLGTIRHRGFIPWDDDVDIAMKREDYQKFLLIIVNETSEFLKLSNIYTDPRWQYPFSRVINGTVINFSAEYLQKFHGCPYPVGVDIFPLDFVPRNKKEEEVLVSVQKLLYETIEILKDKENKNEIENLEENLKEILKQIETLCKVEINREKNLVNQLLKIIDRLSILYKNEESDQIIQYAWWATENKDYRYQKEWYEESILMPFENIMLPVPVYYDEVLKVLYGDYKTPVREYHYHDYPFYKKYDAIIEQYIQNML